MKLQDKHAVIFGGGSADGKITNGLASALAYAREGAAVSIVDLHLEAAEKTCEAIMKNQPQARVYAHQGDVTENDSVARCVANILSKESQIDVLHNNVGMAIMGGPLDLSLEQWNTSLKLNLTSAFLTTKHTLPVMLEQKNGSIINIASVGGMRYIGYDYPSYVAAKSGLIQFTTHLAIQYGREGIRANAISPGYIASPMMFNQITRNYGSVEEMVKDRDRRSPTGSMGTPRDVGEAAAFLASDAARYINGVCLPVDGGLVGQSAPPVEGP